MRAHFVSTDMVTSIDKKAASRLENPYDDQPWDSDSTKFATQIEVFHHLHCLVSRSHPAPFWRRADNLPPPEPPQANGLARAVSRHRVKSFRNSARSSLQSRRPLYPSHQRVAPVQRSTRGPPLAVQSAEEPFGDSVRCASDMWRLQSLTTMGFGPPTTARYRRC